MQVIFNKPVTASSESNYSYMDASKKFLSDNDGKAESSLLHLIVSMCSIDENIKLSKKQFDEIVGALNNSLSEITGQFERDTDLVQYIVDNKADI